MRITHLSRTQENITLTTGLNSLRSIWRLARIEMRIAEKYVIVSLEPSKRLSELCGFPYFIQRRFSVRELLDNKMIDENDVREMRNGGEICKNWRVV